MDTERPGLYDDVGEIGVLYDHVQAYVSRPDVAFYLDVAKATSGAVLELGCGTGRVLLPLARQGLPIVGLDSSARMLAACEASLAREPDAVRERVKLHRADMRDFELGEAFDLVIIPFRPLQHLVSADEQVRCLSAVHRHLRPGGRLVFDLFNPNLRLLVSNRTEEAEDTPETVLPDGRRFRRTGRVVAAHLVEQWLEVELAYYVTEADRAVQRLVQAFPMRWFYRWEVEHLLARCGFRVREVYGSFDLSRLADDSPEMVFVAEREPAE